MLGIIILIVVVGVTSYYFYTKTHRKPSTPKVEPKDPLIEAKCVQPTNVRAIKTND